jgi:hypothetical protein
LEQQKFQTSIGIDVLKDMLPEGNQIADSVYEAKKIICPLGIEVEKSMHERIVVYCPVEIIQTLTRAPSVAMIGTRGKRMVDMIILRMTRTSPARSEARRRRLTGGLL